MNDVAISVVSDPEADAAGNAVIRLTGVGLVPPGSTYRIEPLEEDSASALPQGWPVGDLTPLSSRITRDGVDLVVGPEVVEAPGLMPGTPVAISVASVGARAELRWPSLPVSRAPRRSAVVMSGQQLASERIAREREQQQIALAAAAAIAAATALNENHPAPTFDGDDRPLRAAPVEATDVLTLDTVDEPSQRPEDPSREAIEEPSIPLAAAPTLEMPSEARAADPMELPATSGALADDVEAQSPAPVPPLPAAPIRVSPPAETAPNPPAAAGSLPKPPPVQAAKPSETGAVAGPARTATKSYHATAFSLGCLTACSLAALAWWFNPGAANNQPAASIRPVAAVQAPSEDRASRFAQLQLAHVLAIPSTSPLGRQSHGVNLDEALALADEQLHGDGAARDGREAKYWLRKALATGLGDERLLWAMTQLGSLYARGEGEAADYATARMLWELASTQGDPVATCFLASLHESGLGAAKDRERALGLYTQAKSRGGCRGIDEAIARLGRNGQ